MAHSCIVPAAEALAAKNGIAGIVDSMTRFSTDSELLQDACTALKVLVATGGTASNRLCVSIGAHRALRSGGFCCSQQSLGCVNEVSGFGKRESKRDGTRNDGLFLRWFASAEQQLMI